MPEKKDKNTNKKKIAILFGGCSSEYEVSLQSAYAVITHIDTEAYEPVLIGIARDGKWYLYRGEADRRGAAFRWQYPRTGSCMGFYC